MEKYRSSADPSTGIHPFIPAEDPASSLQVCLLLLLLGPFRLLALLVGAVFTAVLSTVAACLGVVSGTLARPFYRLADAVGLRAVLFGFGVWRAQNPVLGLPRTREGVAGLHPSHGDVVFCNHASYLDPIYLACTYSPVLVVVGANGACYSVSYPAAALNVLSPGRAANSGARKPESLSQVSENAAKRSSGPVVVFAEGTTTNGKGVLAFGVSAKSIPSRAKVFALGLSYSPSRSETYTVGSPWMHVMGRVCAWKSTIRARVARVPVDGDTQRAVADQARAAPLRLSSEARARFESDWGEQARRR
jgi:1-acylglycerol-3-phosphate O-acyltransferase